MKATGGGWYTYPLLLCDSFNQIFSVLIFDQSTNLMHSTIINCWNGGCKIYNKI